MIKEIYAVYGDNLPTSRSDYSATSKSPVAMISINKQYKTWARFVLEYTKYAITQRNLKPNTIEKKKSYVKK